MDRRPDPQELIATCQDKHAFFPVDRGSGPAFDSHNLLPGGDGPWQRFLAAGSKEIGCEPMRETHPKVMT